MGGAYPFGGYGFCMAVAVCSPSAVLPLVILQRESIVCSIVRRIRGRFVYDVNSRDERGGGAVEVYSVMYFGCFKSERPELKCHIRV